MPALTAKKRRYKKQKREDALLYGMPGHLPTVFLRNGSLFQSSGSDPTGEITGFPDPCMVRKP